MFQSDTLRYVVVSVLRRCVYTKHLAVVYLGDIQQTFPSNATE